MIYRGNTLFCRAVFDGAGRRGQCEAGAARREVGAEVAPEAGIARQALVLVEEAGRGDIEVVEDRQRTVRIAEAQ